MDDITATVCMSTLSIVVYNRCTPFQMCNQHTNLQKHTIQLTCLTNYILVTNCRVIHTSCIYLVVPIDIHHIISVASLSFICRAINQQTMVMWCQYVVCCVLTRVMPINNNSLMYMSNGHYANELSDFFYGVCSAPHSPYTPGFYSSVLQHDQLML